MGWGKENVCEESGARWQAFLVAGCVAGKVEQFPGNAPTTYATSANERLGPFSTWDEAKHAVQSRWRTVDL